MGFFKDKVGDFLGIATKKEIEQLNEQLQVANRLLDNSDTKHSMLTPSSMARETTTAEDIQATVLKRVKVKDLQQLYLKHQFIFRGVNVRADELITRGYEIIDGDDTGREKCKNLILNSGGDNLFWQYSVSTDVAGDGYLEKVLNQKENEIKKLIHVNPVNFGYKSDPENRNKIIVDEKTKLPISYEQVVVNDDKAEVRTDVPLNKIAHLRFNTFADEFRGI
jgi:hypothetical protein